MGGSPVRRSQKCLQESRSMTEELGPGFEEAGREEMPEARARLASRSRACLALICCVLSILIVAGLGTFLVLGQLRTPGKGCLRAIPEQTPEPSPQPVYTPSRAKPRAHLTIVQAVEEFKVKFAFLNCDFHYNMLPIPTLLLS
nr:tumor necrosis factor ligand superfamily member 15 [Peromyscus maniculatus bairdii]